MSRGSSPGRDRIFLYCTTSRPTLGTIQPLTQRVPVAYSLGVERPDRETDHLPTSSVDIKNDGAIPPSGMLHHVVRLMSTEAEALFAACFMPVSSLLFSPED
jgi:hypothetical protein